MSRPVIQVTFSGGIKVYGLLDTGSRRSYIRSRLANQFQSVPIQPFTSHIGGKTLQFTEGKLVSGLIQDTEGREYTFSSILFPIRELGTETNTEIDVLFGALILEDWGANIDESSIPPKVDYRLLREGELIEL